MLGNVAGDVVFGGGRGYVWRGLCTTKAAAARRVRAGPNSTQRSNMRRWSRKRKEAADLCKSVDNKVERWAVNCRYEPRKNNGKWRNMKHTVVARAPGGKPTKQVSFFPESPEEWGKAFLWAVGEAIKGVKSLMQKEAIVDVK